MYNLRKISTSSVSGITLSIEAGDNPYFEPEQMRATFRRLFGAPDRTSGTYDFWGPDEGDKQVRAYVNGNSFWVIFERPEFKKPAEVKTSEEKSAKK